MPPATWAATMPTGSTSSRLYEKTSGLLEIGFDFGQVFNFIDHSVGVFAVRWATSAHGPPQCMEGGQHVMAAVHVQQSTGLHQPCVL